MAEECPRCKRRIAAEFKSEDRYGVQQVRIKCAECGYNKVVTNTPDTPCFVATAVFEDPLHPQVCHLRRFRDDYLSTRLWGRAFIVSYYRIGPVLARVVAPRPWLKRPLRVLLAWATKRLP